MRRVAIVGSAHEVGTTNGRNDAELLAPVVEHALAASGMVRDDIGLVCTAGSELLNGVVGGVMGAFDAFPGWPPRTHSHLDGDGAFALHEAWIRLLAGEAEAALVCAFSRPMADDPRRPLGLQLDPYLVGPLGPDVRHLAALQAREMIETGRYDETDLAEVVAARRPGVDVDDVLAQEPIAPPLRPLDCSTVCAGAAAVVLATGELASRADRRPAWIAGIEQAADTHHLGARPLARSPMIEQAASRLDLTGARIDVVEVHATFSHQELIVVDAIGAAEIGRLNPSGGALPADPIMATGLIRLAAVAEAIGSDEATLAVGHATNGPCLQHNLLCRMDAA